MLHSEIATLKINTKPHIAYWINQDYIITDVNEGFQVFGAQNGDQAFLVRSWIGTNLLDIVKGDTTRMLYETLFQKVQITQKPLEFPYRCDSAELARFMRMYISPEKDKHLFIRNEIELEILFVKPVQLQYQTLGLGAVKRCNICNKLKIEQSWTDPLDMHTMKLDFDLVWKIRYELCPSCDETLKHLYTSPSLS